MELSVIIISFNTKSLTEQCLQSIFQAIEKEPQLKDELELIVVDNHSLDGSVELLRQSKRESPIPFTLLANQSNSGFAAANNQAILHAKGSNILLLNSDTIVHPGTFTALINRLHDPESTQVGILAASLTNPDGTPQPQGGDLPSLVSLFCFAFLLDDLPLIGKLLPSHQHTGRRFVLPQEHQLQFKGWVAGTAMAIRSSLIPQIGVLDDQIFMYAEDIEYCWRARKAGWQVAIDPGARIMHFSSKSSSPAKALEGEFLSLKYVLGKHLPKWQHAIAIVLLKIAVANRSRLFALLRNPEKAELYRSLAKTI